VASFQFYTVLNFGPLNRDAHVAWSFKIGWKKY